MRQVAVKVLPGDIVMDSNEPALDQRKEGLGCVDGHVTQDIPPSLWFTV